MRILELFAGTASFSRTCWYHGEIDTFTIDNNPNFCCDLTKDILELSLADLITEDGDWREPDIIWASPPCTSFSQMGVWKHWNYFEPKTEFAKVSIALIDKTISLIRELKPKYWFIENPKSLLRKFPQMQSLPVKEVCYCQYGDHRMKPTDIWTNLDSWIPKSFCHNNCPDHVSSPRSSTTGTQGMTREDAGKIPSLLCQEILFEIKKHIEF